MDTRTDEEIVEGVKQGDKELFGVLVERYEGKMLRYARRFLFDEDESRDLAQNVFVKAYMNIRGFDEKKRFSPWIYRIAHNEFVNGLKKKSRDPVRFFDPDLIFPHPVAEGSLEEDMDRNVMRGILDRNFKALELKYREPLSLHYFEEMEYRQIAEVLRIPVSTVGVRILRGKKLLKKMLEQNHG